jgi:hypothetical protein
VFTDIYTRESSVLLPTSVGPDHHDHDEQSITLHTNAMVRYTGR